VLVRHTMMSAAPPFLHHAHEAFDGEDVDRAPHRSDGQASFAGEAVKHGSGRLAVYWTGPISRSRVRSSAPERRTTYRRDRPSGERQ
jgi:hypothetical protein